MATQSATKSLAKLRKEGYLCAMVERWNKFAGVRQDLYGFIDILAIREGEILGVQTTSLNCFAEHVKKISKHKNLIPVKKSGIKIVLHGWFLGEKKWECKEKIF